MSNERQIELTWRCSSCGHRNLGRHVACQGCGGPKDDSEAYEMPADPSTVASVTDAKLLEMARAGANWRCRYCGSDQRTLAGTCGQCGAAQAEGVSTAFAPHAPPRAAAARPRASRSPLVAAAAGAVLLTMVLGLCALLASRPGARSDSQLLGATRALALPYAEEWARVTAIEWKHTVKVERWQAVSGEGFQEAKPAGAFDVRPIGERFHHNERVLDGYDTQTYSETEPDGFQSESYTEREPCGQDCTPRPETCREKCVPNQNGFATCKTECSGGGQDCQTRYCNVQKTRQVPKQKTVQKTRQVPRYKDVAKNAPFFAWKSFTWQPARSLVKSGATLDATWPSDDEVKLGVGLKPGEKERASRFQEYQVALGTSAGIRKVHVATLGELGRHPPDSRQRVRLWTNGRVELR